MSVEALSLLSLSVVKVRLLVGGGRGSPLWINVAQKNDHLDRPSHAIITQRVSGGD